MNSSEVNVPTVISLMLTSELHEYKDQLESSLEFLEYSLDVNHPEITLCLNEFTKVSKEIQTRKGA